MKRLPLLVCCLLPVLVAAQDAKTIPAGPLATPDDAFTHALKKAAAAPIVTIVSKPRPSPTGDAHDYISYGRYYWPDPAKPGGLPYLRKDGHPNRDQIKLGDDKQLAALIANVEALTKGWTRLHREDCARRAGEWLRAWFITPDTRIKPAFDYAQIRLGHDHNRGSASGLIDTRDLARLADAVGQLHGAPGFGAADETAVKEWFAAYLQWLTTSPNGRKEHEAANNHGSWYLVQAVAIARLLGRDDEARAFAREDFDRISRQIEPDGRQPLEIARVDGLSYSVFNLEAQLNLARRAAPLGIDLWHYISPRGGSLRQALDYLRPFDAAPEKWPHAQLAQRPPGFLKPLLAIAAQLDAEPVRK